MVNVGEYTTIHGIVYEWILFKPYKRQLSIKPEEPPIFGLIFVIFASENSPWFLLKNFRTPLGSFKEHQKNNRPPKGFPSVLGRFQIPPVCNPKCLSLLHQGKYEDAEQVKSGSWVQLRKISKFWGATSRCTKKMSPERFGKPFGNGKKRMFFQSQVKVKLYTYVHMSSFFVVSKDAQFQGKNFLRYGTQKGVDFFQTHQSIHMGVS